MRTVIEGGTIVTASDIYVADVLVSDGKVRAIGIDLPKDVDRVIDARGKYLLPGGIDVHTHCEMPFGGTTSCDDFETGTRAAAFGGTTTIIDFPIQSKGKTLREAIENWQQKARGKACVDYAFHVIVTDLPDHKMNEIQELVEDGVTSFKVFLAYKGSMQVDDSTLLKLLMKTKECGALVTCHGENADVIDVLTRQMITAGKVAPKYHALSRPELAEAEATNRAIALAEIAEAPIYIVHVSTAAALSNVIAARERGLPVYAETCPQYLVTSVDLYDEPGFNGARYVCSPPLRDKSNWQPLWNGLAAGHLQTIASDHCPFNFKGQKELGRNSFSLIPNGVAGIETRMNLMYTYGVLGGKIGLNRFVDAIATSPAKLFGLYPQKGTVAVGSDADLVVFDPAIEHVITQPALHQRVDYTPYEGFPVKGKPVVVMSRGEVIVDRDQFLGTAGDGQFLKRKRFAYER